jgi:hypothetical protein
MSTFKIGDFARNVESGWLGRIVRFKEERVWIDDIRYFDETTAEMIGVDELCALVDGLNFAEALSDNDRQWHDVKDLRPARDPLRNREAGGATH